MAAPITLRLAPLPRGHSTSFLAPRSSLEASYATRGYDAIAQIEQLLVEALHEDRVHHGGRATHAMMAASDETRRWLVPKLPAWSGPTPLETTLATHDAACHALPGCAF